MPEPDSTTSVEFIDKLNTIKTTLNLSISQLSELFYVSHKTVYDWYDGITQPNSNIIQRVDILIDILYTLPSDVNIRRLKSIWKIPIYNKSFLAVFTTTQIDFLREKIIEKLKQMHDMLVVHHNTPKHHPPLGFGDAHLADLERRVYFD